MGIKNKPSSNEQTQKLRSQLRKAKAEIKSLKQYIYESARDAALYMFEVYQREIEQYEPFINPYSIKIEATHNNKRLVFEISPREILCVLTKGRAKYIYLKEPVKSISGSLVRTDKICVNKNEITLEKLRQTLDSLHFNLEIVSKRALVNVAYYRHVGKHFELTIPSIYKEIKKIGGTPRYSWGFDGIQANFEMIHSLQKRAIDYKQKKEALTSAKFEPKSKTLKNETKKQNPSPKKPKK